MRLRQRLIPFVLILVGALAIGCGQPSLGPDEVTPEMQEMDRKAVDQIEGQEGGEG